MAKDKGHENVSAGQVPGAELPAGFIAIQDHRPMYKVEDCNSAPVRGFLLGVQKMSPAKGTNNREWEALVVKLTEDCPAVSPDGEVQLYGPGTEILVGGVDNASLYRTASNETSAFEVILVPREKALKLDGGRRMYIFDKAIHPKAHNRQAENLLFFGKEALTLSAGQESRGMAGGSVGQNSNHDAGASLPVS